MDGTEQQKEAFLAANEHEDACPPPEDSTLRIQVDRRVYNKHTFDAAFGAPNKPASSATLRQRASYANRKCKAACAPRKLADSALSLVPFVQTVREYRWRQDIGMDLLAGVSVGMVHIPQGMGFALLAAVAPVYGLYASFWQVLIYTLFGRCRHLSLGTMAVISLIIGAVVEREVVLWKQLTAARIDATLAQTSTGVVIVAYGVTSAEVMSTGGDGGFLLEAANTTAGVFSEVAAVAEGLTEEDRFRSSIACSVSLIAGITMLAMGVLRLGVLTTFMPTSFIGGFTTGAAFHITTTQLKSLLNVSVKRYGGMFNLPFSVFEVIKAIPRTSIPDLIITIICFSFLVFIKEFINVRFRKKIKIPIPAEMVVVVLATLLSFAVGFHERWNVKIVGFIPQGIPGPVMPNMDRASTYAIDGVIAGITSFAISISMVDILSSKYKYHVDPNRELVSYGLAYGISAFLHCFVGAAAPPRCFVMELTGGKTQMASVFTSLLLLLVLLLIAPAFRYLPNASLACIIVVALFPLFKQFTLLPRLWRVSKSDLFIWVTTFVVCVFIDVSVALAVGIFVAVLCAVLPSLYSKGYVYGDAGGAADLSAPVLTHSKVRARSDVVVFRYESTLYFVTIKNFKKELFRSVFDPAHPPNSAAVDNGAGGTDKELVDMQGSHKPGVPSPKGGVRGVVLDCAPICYVDLMGLDTLKQLRAGYQEVGVQFVLADCNPNLLRKLTEAGMLEEAGGIDIFPTVQDAVATLSSGSCSNSSDYCKQ